MGEISTECQDARQPLSHGGLDPKARAAHSLLTAAKGYEA